MKIILAALDPNKFYRLELSDKILADTLLAWVGLKHSLFEGILWVNTIAYHLNTCTSVPCRVVITNGVTAYVENFGIEENLLEPSDNLLALPDVYLTRRFRILLDSAYKYLSEGDVELVTSWQQIHSKILEKYSQS